MPHCSCAGTRDGAGPPLEHAFANPVFRIAIHRVVPRPIGWLGPAPVPVRTPVPQCRADFIGGTSIHDPRFPESQPGMDSSLEQLWAGQARDSVLTRMFRAASYGLAYAKLHATEPAVRTGLGQARHGLGKAVAGPPMDTIVSE